MKYARIFFLGLMSFCLVHGTQALPGQRAVQLILKQIKNIQQMVKTTKPAAEKIARQSAAFVDGAQTKNQVKKTSSYADVFNEWVNVFINLFQ